MQCYGMQRLKQDGIEKIWLENEGNVAFISKQYKVSCSMVYSAMREHCKYEGKDYESFLRRPHKPHKSYVRKSMEIRKKPSSSFEECIMYISDLLNSDEDNDFFKAIDLLIIQVEKEF